MNRAVIVLAILIYGVLMVRLQQKSTPLPKPSPVPVVIEVGGDVKRPGVYLLESGHPTVRDAIEAAGGLSEDGGAPKETKDDAGLSPSTRLEGTAAVHTGQQIRVLREGMTGWRAIARPMGAAATLALGGKLDINEASAEELMLIPHMKAEFASAIVERRSHRGAWRDIKEIEEISGIGPKTVAGWKDYLEATTGPNRKEERQKEGKPL